MLGKPPNFLRIAEALNFEGLRYVLIGGFAVAVHGAIRATLDVDLAIAFNAENRKILAEALAPLHPRPQRLIEGAAWVWDELCIRAPWSIFETDAGRVDLVVTLSGVDSFEGLYDRSLLVNFHGTPLRVASLKDLISMKTVADRPRDREDVAALRSIQELSQ